MFDRAGSLAKQCTLTIADVQSEELRTFIAAAVAVGSDPSSKHRAGFVFETTEKYHLCGPVPLTSVSAFTSFLSRSATSVQGSDETPKRRYAFVIKFGNLVAATVFFPENDTAPLGCYAVMARRGRPVTSWRLKRVGEEDTLPHSIRVLGLLLQSARALLTALGIPGLIIGTLCLALGAMLGNTGLILAGAVIGFAAVGMMLTANSMWR